VRTFSEGYLEIERFNGEFHAINVASLDHATDEGLAQALLQYEDGWNGIGSRRPLKRVTCDANSIAFGLLNLPPSFRVTLSPGREGGHDPRAEFCFWPILLQKSFEAAVEQ